MECEYPKRPSFFAYRFCRLMAKACLANEVGAETCWLLTIIAQTEDARGYRGPVSYFNEQLYPMVGLGSVDALHRVRTKAINSGWLHYEPGGRHRAGRYWVIVPEHLKDWDDGPTDEGSPQEIPPRNRGSNREESAELAPSNGVSSAKSRKEPRGKCGSNREESAEPSSLALLQDLQEPIDLQEDLSPSEPAPAPEAPAPRFPPHLLELIAGWNSLGSDVVMPGNGARPNPPAKEVLTGWQRAQRDPDMRQSLADIPAVLAACRKATFCHRKGWFSLPWLFARNKNGECNVCRLLIGAFNGDQHNGHQRTFQRGPGQRYEGTPPTKVGTF